jgi:hypothetical protein
MARSAEAVSIQFLLLHSKHVGHDIELKIPLGHTVSKWKVERHQPRPTEIFSSVPAPPGADADAKNRT